MRIKSALLLIFAFLFSALPNMASAQPVSECKIQASSFQQISIGFPINPERLAKILNPKILVIPYRLKDDKAFEFGNKEKEAFTKASDNIYKFSDGKSRVTFSYNEIINVDMTVQERNLIKAPNNSYSEWQERYDKSTWGFMKKFITEQDRNIDYSGYDGIVLFSTTSIFGAENAEAMTMTKDLYGPWFNPITTAEGQISNVVVLYNQKSEYVITHEIMHLYGLTDLYGSQTSARNSLMSDGTIGLLAWERWVLGWLDDENIQCVSETNEVKLDSVDNVFSLDYSKRDQLLVIPTGTKTALVIDLVKRDSQSWISYYALDNDARPPITAFRSNNFDLYTEITGRLGVGTVIDSPKYTIVIKDNDGRKLSLNLIPKSLSSSTSAKQLITEAENTRLAYIKIAQAERDAKAAAELKAKQEAEAKVAAELKAKQEAEAKVAAELKVKLEAEAKAVADKAAEELRVKQEAEAKLAADKIAADLKVKQEAEAKLAADKTAADLKAKQEADAKAAADKAALVVKKTTITCVKGKLTKKVTAVKPVCPKGYKKK
jgi:M6 family metalloprotease-like protein